MSEDGACDGVKRSMLRAEPRGGKREKHVTPQSSHSSSSMYSFDPASRRCTELPCFIERGVWDPQLKFSPWRNCREKFSALLEENAREALSKFVWCEEGRFFGAILKLVSTCTGVFTSMSEQASTKPGKPGPRNLLEGKKYVNFGKTGYWSAKIGVSLHLLSFSDERGLACKPLETGGYIFF